MYVYIYHCSLHSSLFLFFPSNPAARFFERAKGSDSPEPLWPDSPEPDQSSNPMPLPTPQPIPRPSRCHTPSHSTPNVIPIPIACLTQPCPLHY